MSGERASFKSCDAYDPEEIVSALLDNKCNQKFTAALLGVSRCALNRWIHRELGPLWLIENSPERPWSFPTEEAILPESGENRRWRAIRNAIEHCHAANRGDRDATATDLGIHRRRLFDWLDPAGRVRPSAGFKPRFGSYIFEVERRVILDVLRNSKTKSCAAEILGIDMRFLQSRIVLYRTLGILAQ